MCWSRLHERIWKDTHINNKLTVMIKMTCKSKEQKTGWGIVNAMGRWEVGKIASN